MSYNGYNNSNSYLPYFQQTPGQDGRTQYQHQHQSRNTAGYQNNSYQPLSAYQQQAQCFAPQAASISAHGNQGYGNLNASETTSQDSKGNHANTGRSVDTSALGNLAYVSSLGRDNPSLQQIMDYNRTQNTASYGNNGSRGINSAASLQSGTGLGRTDSRSSSREVTSARPQPTTSGTSFSYTPSNGNTGYQGQQTGATECGQGQAQHTAARSSTLSQYTSQPPRPTSGQTIQHSHSRTGPQPLQSPTIRAHQAGSNQSRSEGSIRGSEQTKGQSPLQQVHQNSSTPTGYRSGPPTQKVRTPQATHGSAGSANRSQHNAQPPLSQPAPSRNAHQSPAIDARVNEETSLTTTSVGNPYPTTVDPSQVFNHYEYSRRQAEAETARRKAAEAAQAAPQPKDITMNNARTRNDKGISMPQQVNGAPSNSDIDPDTAKKNQMELEMKQMIEKMRDYKSKDPSLFSQIWEQVKKEQPAQQAPSQPAPQDLSTSPIVGNGQLPSPNAAQAQLPRESELPPAQPADLDRGRFPAQLRRRGGKNDTPSRNSATPVNGQSASATTTTTPTPHVSRLGEPVPDPGTQTMKTAMQQFHRTSSSPMPPGNPAALAPAKNKTVQQNESSSTPTPAPNAQQPFHPPKPGGTYWPENKKWSLAEAARNALTTTRLNKGKQITTEELHELLDQNPSYTQICEILEYRGFVIDRGQFARLLLSAVPDLRASNAWNTLTKPPPTAPPPQSIMPQPPPYSVPPRPHNNACTTPYAAPNAGPSPQAGAHENLSFSAPSAGSDALQPGTTTQGKSSRPEGRPSATTMTANDLDWADIRKLTDASLGHFANDQGKIERQGRHPYINDLSRPHNDIPKPPTKQELARKRKFGDIVDLTQLSDEERPPQQERLEIANSLPPSTLKGHDLAPFPSSTEEVTQQQVINGKATSVLGKDAQVGMKQFRYKTSGRECLWNQENIIRPMNKRQDALRRSSYSPKTIARDILFALGKHPTMRPLNAHLDVLRDRFQSVNYDSDLSTFRWDLVDPGGDPVHTQAAPVLAAADANDADDENADAPSSRSPINCHRPRISVVIGGGPATSEGGSFTPGEADSRTGKDSLLISSLDAASVVRPAKDTTPNRVRGRPSRGGHTGSVVRSRTSGTISSSQEQGTPLQQEAIPSQQQTSNQGSNNPEGNTYPQDLSRFMYNNPSSMRTPSVPKPSFDSSLFRTPDSVPPQSAASATNPGSEKRKGRPPGAKNKKPRPDKGIPRRRSLDQTPGNSEAFIPTRPHINTSTTTPAQPSGLRNAMSPADGISDLRNGITPTDGIAVMIPSRSPSVAKTPNTESAMRGRPKKMPVPSGRYPSQPSYKVYKCLWENCPAELHNLETLKKHVRKHRDKFEKAPFPCLWANCYNSNISVTKKPQNVGSSECKRERLSFESGEAWEKHLERKHVNAVAWELGDGPATHSSDYDSSDYMSDSRSYQPTPRARPSGRPNPISTSMSPPPKPSQGNGKARADSTELERSLAQIEAHGRNFRTNLFS